MHILSYEERRLNLTEHKEVVKSIKNKIGFKPHILETLEELDPEFLGKYARCDRKLLSDGALSAKTKILMALQSWHPSNVKPVL